MQSNLSHIAGIVLPVLVALGLGYLARGRQILTDAQVNGLKTFVVTFSLPAVIFGAFSKIQYTLDILLIALLVYGACIAAYLFGKVARRMGKGNDTLLPFVVTGFEAGMMGYALYAMIFGAENLTSIAAVALGGDLFVFTLYITFIKRQNGVPPKRMLLETITSPVFCAIAAGVLLGATGIADKLYATDIGAVLTGTLDFIAAPTSCAILFVVGYGIDFSGGALREASRSALARLVIMAVLCIPTLLIAKQMPTTDSYRIWAIVLLFSLPGPYVLPVFVKDGKDARYAATCLSLYTLLSILLFCIIAAVAS